MDGVQLRRYLQKYQKKHLIFDLDETIAHLHIDWSNFRDQFFRLVKDIDSALVSSIENVGGAANILYNQFIQKHGIEGKRVVDQFCLIWERDKISGLTPNTSLKEFVVQNQRQYSMYIWTNNNRDTAMQALKQIDLHRVFQKIVAKEDVRLSKPHPDGFYQFFDKESHAKQDFLMIGNSAADEEAATAAGIDFFLIDMHQK